jgi:hypothetical protein
MTRPPRLRRNSALPIPHQRLMLPYENAASLIRRPADTFPPASVFAFFACFCEFLSSVPTLQIIEPFLFPLTTDNRPLTTP